MKSKMTSDKWIGLVNKQRDSGISAAEFARQNNLNLSTFQYWSKKVKDSNNVKLVKVSPKPTVVVEPTLLMINNFKIEIPASASSQKIAKIISVIREDI